MARKSSAHIGAVTTGAFVHNDRRVELTYLIDTTENNEVDVSAPVAYQNFIKLKQEAIQSYVLRVGQEPQKNTEYLKEVIINLEKHHTMKDLQPIADFLEKTGIDMMIKAKDKPIFDIKTKKKKWTYKYEKKNVKIKILQKSIHRDEGFIEEEGLSGKQERQFNYHAHMDFFAIDPETGLSIKFKSRDYERLQDITAEALNMERGKQSRKGEGKTKRLDTFDFKKHKEREAETVKQAENRILYEISEAMGLEIPTLKEMKAHISKLRIDLVSANKQIPKEGEVIFNKEDYAAVSKLKNSLKASNVKFLYQEYLTMKQGFEDRIGEAEAKIKILETEKEDLKEKAKKAEAKNQKTKDENERYKERRREEHQRTLESINRATERLNAIARTSFDRIAEACEAKRTAEADARIAESIAIELEPVLTTIQGNIRQVIHEKTLEKIKEPVIKEVVRKVKVEVPAKITMNDVKNLAIKVGDVSTTIDDYIMSLRADKKQLEKELNKEPVVITKEVEVIKEVKIEVAREIAVDEAISVLSKHTNLEENTIIKAVKNEVEREQRSLSYLNIEIENREGEHLKDDHYIAYIRDDESDENNKLVEASSAEISYISELKNKTIKYLTEKLSVGISKLMKGLSPEWLNTAARVKKDKKAKTHNHIQSTLKP